MTVNLISGGITHVGLAGSETIEPYYLASGITSADEGKPVKLDTSADFSVALAGDGDVPIGVLDKVENRLVEGILVGSVCVKGTRTLIYKSGDTVAIGDKVVGGGSGEVKTVALSTAVNYTRVVAKRATGGVNAREVDVKFGII